MASTLCVVSFPDHFFLFLFVVAPPQIKTKKVVWERDYFVCVCVCVCVCMCVCVHVAHTCRHKVLEMSGLLDI